MGATYGFHAVFGIQKPKPILGLPEGRARLRMRCEDFAQVFVKTKDGIRRFYVTDLGEHWAVPIEIGSNLTIQQDGI